MGTDRSTMPKIIGIIFLMLTSALFAATQDQINAIQNEINELQRQIVALKKARSKKKETPKRADTDHLLRGNKIFIPLFTNSPATFMREDLLLDAIANNSVAKDSVYIGARLQPQINSNSGSKDNSELFIGTRFGIVARMSEYTTAFVSLNIANTEVKPFYNYLLIGNVAKFPIYSIMGFKYLDFGAMPRFTSIISPIIRTFWIKQTRQVSLGYREENGNGLNLQLTAFNGEDKTNTDTSQVSNFAANGFYQLNFSEKLILKPGAGYLHGMPNTGKLPNGTKVALTEDGQRTGAADVFLNGCYFCSDGTKLLFNLEYVQGLNKDLNNQYTQAWMLGGKISTKIYGKKMKFSLSESSLKANGVTYTQWLIGTGILLAGISIGLDYSYLQQSNDLYDNTVNLSFTFNMH
jgi:hypothetical protein